MASKQGISVGAEGRSWVWEPGQLLVFLSLGGPMVFPQGCWHQTLLASCYPERVERSILRPLGQCGVPGTREEELSRGLATGSTSRRVCRVLPRFCGMQSKQCSGSSNTP